MYLNVLFICYYYLCMVSCDNEIVCDVVGRNLASAEDSGSIHGCCLTINVFKMEVVPWNKTETEVPRPENETVLIRIPEMQKNGTRKGK